MSNADDEDALGGIDGWDDPNDVLSDYLDEWNATGKRPGCLAYLRRLPIFQWREAKAMMRMTDILKAKAIEDRAAGVRWS